MSWLSREEIIWRFPLFSPSLLAWRGLLLFILGNGSLCRPIWTCQVLRPKAGLGEHQGSEISQQLHLCNEIIFLWNWLFALLKTYSYLLVIFCSLKDTGARCDLQRSCFSVQKEEGRGREMDPRFWTRLVLAWDSSAALSTHIRLLTNDYRSIDRIQLPLVAFVDNYTQVNTCTQIHIWFK